MDTLPKRLGRLAVVLVGAFLGAVLGWVLFVRIPGGSMAALVGVLLTIVVAILLLRTASNFADRAFAPYNAATVSVEGPITRSGAPPMPGREGAMPADAVVEQIEEADDDPNTEALVVELNTPGGEVVPSDDIRLAASEFDGPTVAYAMDTCASGGYWIASGCDRIFAREGSVVGSIGVIGSRINATELADKLGIDYERLAAGKYKDAGVPLKEFTEDDREYLQGIVDDYYDTFVDRVSEGRDLDEETVRDTEARVFLGEEAHDIGLVDELGTDEDVQEYLEETLGESVEFRHFEPTPPLVKRVRFGAQSLAYSFGAGLAGVFTEGEGDTGWQFR